MARLFQMAGHGLAADLALTGRVMEADEALRHGIVSRVVPRDELDTTVLEMARTIASRPRLAVELAKGTIQRLATPAVLDTLDRELLAQSTVMASPEFRSSRRARLTGPSGPSGPGRSADDGARTSLSTCGSLGKSVDDHHLRGT